MSVKGTLVGTHRTHFRSHIWRSEVKGPVWIWPCQMFIAKVVQVIPLSHRGLNQGWTRVGCVYERVNPHWSTHLCDPGREVGQTRIGGRWRAGEGQRSVTLNEHNKAAEWERHPPLRYTKTHRVNSKPTTSRYRQLYAHLFLKHVYTSSICNVTFFNFLCFKINLQKDPSVACSLCYKVTNPAFVHYIIKQLAN